MNKIFNVLFTGMLALGIMTANAESQISAGLPII